MKNKKAAFWVIVMPVVAMIGSAFLLTAIFGPSDDGLNCMRGSAGSECAIRQTRFFGLIGNSSFSVPESSIHGAEAVCASAKVGGHASPSCAVYLMLDGEKEYPVLSYPLSSQANSAAGKLNAYFRNDSARRIEIKENVFTSVLMFGVAPLLLIALLFVCLRTRTARGSALAAQAGS
jgi:hypothetical protein